MFGKWRRRSSGTGQSQSDQRNQDSTEAFARTLARVPLFIDLSKREIHRLAVTCRERDYAAGDVLVRQGEPGVGLFVIVSGRVQITQHHADAVSAAIATSGPGDVFGEMSLLDDLPRSATVTALEPTRVLLLPVFDFRAALQEEPDIGIRLLAVLSRRLRRAESRQI
ncbi:MAG TPA: cyclic nucleotide-binding domain-containing protein [Ktedonobacterales bacterium]